MKLVVSKWLEWSLALPMPCFSRIIFLCILHLLHVALRDASISGDDYWRSGSYCLPCGKPSSYYFQAGIDPCSAKECCRF